jgi:TyrR family helix-turn-helix protein
MNNPMRLDIISEDRLGITQEMLSVIVKKGWNLVSVEMYTHHTFVHIQEKGISLAIIKKSLIAISGVKDIIEVPLLPGEEKRKHLDTLLSKLPDPILDIDVHGKILVANTEAEKALGLIKEKLEGQNICDLLNVRLSLLLADEPQSIETSCSNKQFLMDITPIFTNSKVTGAVIVLHSPERLGQKISAIQPQTGDDIKSIIGHSVKIKNIQQQTIRFAKLDLPVLIIGETGTGKELFARALHESGKRAKSPFLAINCATLAENLLESELFGYAPGAFSGAQKSGKPGLFELAENGTVFLDEIGEMSVYLQAKLLRFLQDFTFRRIGGTHEIQVNVRIVCATHRNLEQMVVDGLFREDLYYRLNVLGIDLPPLRERSEDIPDLVHFFSIKACEQINMTCPKFSHSALLLLEKFNWPGNIRQLQNVIFRTLALTDKTIIEDKDICFSTTADEDTSNNFLDADISTLAYAIDEFEKKLLSKLYINYPSTRKLAQRLSVSHAKISRKLKKHNISKSN